MPDHPRILILTARTGGGHLSLADALRDMLADHYSVTIADMLPNFFHLQYRFAGHYALWLWAAEFHLSNNPRQALASERSVASLIESRLKRALDETRPDLVITTHSLLSHSVKLVMQKHAPAITFAMLFSDPYSVHATWFSAPEAEASFAPTRESRELALAAGYDPQRVHLTGWPVREEFYHAGQVDRQEILSYLGLEPGRFTVFLQGGGDGATDYWKSARPLLAACKDMQIILSAGTYRALLRRFRSIERLRVLPLTREIAPFMAASDVIMGKAGPNVLFEAMALEKPFIATTYFPGQEKGNLEFMQRHGIGRVALEFEQQYELLQGLKDIQNPRDRLTPKLQEYREWNSAANENVLAVVRTLIGH
ncbi:MAG TPA: glycosyltransferase [Ktedonobacteraceae bacterium]|nr:glycosyltransferase [Ktedonobacteraceae bacterium]